MIEPSRRKKFHNVPFGESRLAHRHAERQYPLESTTGCMKRRILSTSLLAVGSLPGCMSPSGHKEPRPLAAGAEGMPPKAAAAAGQGRGPEKRHMQCRNYCSLCGLGEFHQNQFFVIQQLLNARSLPDAIKMSQTVRECRCVGPELGAAAQAPEEVCIRSREVVKEKFPTCKQAVGIFVVLE
jgi:hypothetical protein